MSAKIYLVTGSSRGIGLGLVRDLISRGHKVLAACRNPETATELKNLLKDNGQPEPVKCDVTSDQSVRHSAVCVYKTQAPDLRIKKIATSL